MRGTGPDDALVTVVEGLGLGALGGLVATGAMYAVAASDLTATSVPLSSWGAATEVGFGGGVGSVLGLSGWPLHLVHGLVIGMVFGVALRALWPRVGVTAAVGVGLGLGLVLWAGVLALVPATRAIEGAGPPLVLALLMHLTFGGVVAATVLGAARWLRETRRPEK